MSSPFLVGMVVTRQTHTCVRDCVCNNNYWQKRSWFWRSKEGVYGRVLREEREGCKWCNCIIIVSKNKRRNKKCSPPLHLTGNLSALGKFCGSHAPSSGQSLPLSLLFVLFFFFNFLVLLFKMCNLLAVSTFILCGTKSTSCALIFFIFKKWNPTSIKQ